MKRLIFFLFIQIAAFTFAAANKPLKAVIYGRFSGDFNNIAKIRILYCDKYVYNADNNYDTILIPDSAGRFVLRIPMNEKIGKIRQFGIIYNRENDYDVLENYVVESGDSIEMDIAINVDTVKNISVSGQGAAKYQCRSDNILKIWEYKWVTGKQLDDSLGGRFGVYNSPNSLPAMFNSLSMLQSKLLQHLQNYITKISPFAFQVMKADILGSLPSPNGIIDIYYSHLNSFTKDDSVKMKLKKMTIDFYFSHELADQLFPDSVIALSPDYLDFYIYARMENRIFFEKKLERFDKVSFNDLYYGFKKTYKGQLRERLLMLMIVDQFRNFQLIGMDHEKQKSFIDDALGVIKTKSFIDKIEATPLVKAFPGSVAYDFNLPDTSNHFIRLSDFRDSVVVMDMWYTGCTGCAIFAKKLKEEIKPLLVNAKNIKYVSICTDDTRALWLKSLYSGKYTEPININLHLPAGSELEFYKTPMIKYYGLEGLPFILLIDKRGRIIAQVTDYDKGADIVSMIKKEL